MITITGKPHMFIMSCSAAPPILLFLFLLASDGRPAAAPGRIRKVGGRTEVADVGSNREVQELGRFAVDEHNRRVTGGGELAFRRVVRAERQVVSGIKYFLWVVASPHDNDSSGDDEMAPGMADGEEARFLAVVVVKLWLGESSGAKELLSFASSPSGRPHATANDDDSNLLLLRRRRC